MKRLAFYLLCFLAVFIITTNTQAFQKSTLQKKLYTLESASQGKIGISAIDMQNGRSIGYHDTQRFAMQSTIKLIIVSAIFEKSVSKPELLNETISYKKSDLVTWSPVTQQHLSQGMTNLALCKASIMHSDNTAANLLIQQLGGPRAINRFLRKIGDTNTRLDHWEPHLNSNPDNPQDSTTPLAMMKNIKNLMLGNVLTPHEKEKLKQWMLYNTTGNLRIRAGMPQNWLVGDKTGSGNYGVTNDIAIIWPPHHAPIIMAIYFTAYTKNAPQQEDIIASAAKLALQSLLQK